MPADEDDVHDTYSHMVRARRKFRASGAEGLACRHCDAWRSKEDAHKDLYFFNVKCFLQMVMTRSCGDRIYTDTRHEHDCRGLRRLFGKLFFCFNCKLLQRNEALTFFFLCYFNKTTNFHKLPDHKKKYKINTKKNPSGISAATIVNAGRGRHKEISF